eukprot:TRINITY_DN11183_c0_g3_i1.p1 TRINITY_DN11183_c0_g3~~TRINITY_DN11183_c0_g3_i1.p1  ORF type:complete len:1199 (+),score=411.13 TRINITY_DN11183_c0_g3_i1:66-3599(+)
MDLPTLQPARIEDVLPTVLDRRRSLSLRCEQRKDTMLTTSSLSPVGRSRPKLHVHPLAGGGGGGGASMSSPMAMRAALAPGASGTRPLNAFGSPTHLQQAQQARARRGLLLAHSPTALDRASPVPEGRARAASAAGELKQLLPLRTEGSMRRRQSLSGGNPTQPVEYSPPFVPSWRGTGAPAPAVASLGSAVAVMKWDSAASPAQRERIAAAAALRFPAHDTPSQKVAMIDSLHPREIDQAIEVQGRHAHIPATDDAADPGTAPRVASEAGAVDDTPQSPDDVSVVYVQDRGDALSTQGQPPETPPDGGPAPAQEEPQARQGHHYVVQACGMSERETYEEYLRRQTLADRQQLELKMERHKAQERARIEELKANVAARAERRRSSSHSPLRSRPVGSPSAAAKARSTALGPLRADAQYREYQDPPLREPHATPATTTRPLVGPWTNGTAPLEEQERLGELLELRGLEGVRQDADDAVPCSPLGRSSTEEADAGTGDEEEEEETAGGQTLPEVPARRRPAAGGFMAATAASVNRQRDGVDRPVRLKRRSLSHTVPAPATRSDSGSASPRAMMSRAMGSGSGNLGGYCVQMSPRLQSSMALSAEPLLPMPEGKGLSFYQVAHLYKGAADRPNPLLDAGYATLKAEKQYSIRCRCAVLGVRPRIALNLLLWEYRARARARGFEVDEGACDIDELFEIIDAVQVLNIHTITKIGGVAKKAKRKILSTRQRDQGNPAFMTPQSLTARHGIRKEEAFIDIVNDLWDLMPKCPPPNDNCIDRQIYHWMCARILDGDVPEEERSGARFEYADDWWYESGGEWFMDWSAFFNSIFTYVDVWVPKICVDEYVLKVEDLMSLFATDANHGGHVSFSFSEKLAQRQWMEWLEFLGCKAEAQAFQQDISGLTPVPILKKKKAPLQRRVTPLSPEKYPYVNMHMYNKISRRGTRMKDDPVRDAARVRSSSLAGSTKSISSVVSPSAGSSVSPAKSGYTFPMSPADSEASLLDTTVAPPPGGSFSAARKHSMKGEDGPSSPAFPMSPTRKGSSVVGFHGLPQSPARRGLERRESKLPAPVETEVPHSALCQAKMQARADMLRSASEHQIDTSAVAAAMRSPQTTSPRTSALHAALPSTRLGPLGRVMAPISPAARGGVVAKQTLAPLFNGGDDEAEKKKEKATSKNRPFMAM